jgi:hypothetical protein
MSARLPPEARGVTLCAGRQTDGSVGGAECQTRHVMDCHAFGDVTVVVSLTPRLGDVIHADEQGAD